MGFLLFPFLISYVPLTYTPDPLNKIVKALVIIGIVFHEVCHLLMCIITGAKNTKKWWKEKKKGEKANSENAQSSNYQSM